MAESNPYANQNPFNTSASNTGASAGGGMLVSNIEIIPGRRIRTHLGIVQGSTVRTKHVGKDLLAGLKNIVGGELKSYTELLQEAREEATQRMIAQAKSMGANGVINVRYSTASITAGAAEILAYGTAVVLE
ncbi:MAG: YbjQ family protein [Burkholderiales bacterium]